MPQQCSRDAAMGRSGSRGSGSEPADRPTNLRRGGACSCGVRVECDAPGTRVVLDSSFRVDSTLTHMTIQVTQLRLNSNPKDANLTQLRLNSKPKFTNLTRL